MNTTSKLLSLLLCFTLVFGNSLISFAQTPENNNVTESGNPNKKSPRDDVYDRYMTSERRILNYENLHEKDILWEKRVWRLIDVREKRNHHFSFQKNTFIEVLLKAAKSGNITAYNMADDEFKTPFTPEETQNMGNSVDTIISFNPEDYSEVVNVVVNELNPNDVKQFRLKEVYFFDEERSDLDVRILGIAPIVERYDRDGNFLNSGPMFWAYYPELRPILAKTSSFNEGNDVDHMSWEDIFEERIFASYIYKESNVHDRKISEYKAGIDILYESDKIKDNIFHFEHDVWDY